jgi:hypothetical protein
MAVAVVVFTTALRAAAIVCTAVAVAVLLLAARLFMAALAVQTQWARPRVAAAGIPLPGT